MNCADGCLARPSSIALGASFWIHSLCDPVRRPPGGRTSPDGSSARISSRRCNEYVMESERRRQQQQQQQQQHEESDGKGANRLGFLGVMRMTVMCGGRSLTTVRRTSIQSFHVLNEDGTRVTNTVRRRSDISQKHKGIKLSCRFGGARSTNATHHSTQQARSTRQKQQQQRSSCSYKPTRRRWASAILHSMLL